MTENRPIQIDLQAVLADKLGRKSRYVPRWLVAKLEKLICKDRLNALLRNNFPKRGAEFCGGVLSDLGISVEVNPASVMPDRADKRVILVSNHPLGGLDGMALIRWATEYYGCNVHFVVNDLLMAVEPLQPVFLPINKHGGQSRASLSLIDEALAGHDPVIIFPAGLVSRRGASGRIADLEWQKMFVNKAIAHRRDIVPLHFGGHNSDGFYRLARWRKRLGLKFNFEMLCLPRELFRSEGSTFTITIGSTISYKELRGGSGAKAQADAIRRLVYALAENPHTT